MASIFQPVSLDSRYPRVPLLDAGTLRTHKDIEVSPEWLASHPTRQGEGEISKSLYRSFMPQPALRRAPAAAGSKPEARSRNRMPALPRGRWSLTHPSCWPAQRCSRQWGGWPTLGSGSNVWVPHPSFLSSEGWETTTLKRQVFWPFPQVPLPRPRMARTPKTLKPAPQGSLCTQQA